MTAVLDHPLVVFVLCLVVLWLSAQIGVRIRRKRRLLNEDEYADLGVIQGAALTLLALIIGFSFSMAVGRYDQRKNLEEEEANAIGTEYVRAGLLPAAEAARVRQFLKSYVDQRVLFYTTRDANRLEQVNAAIDRLQSDLWSAIQAPVNAQPTPVAALVASGMNDVLNSQGYTQAAWWNRIPVAAWCLMLAIGIAGNVLVGFTMREAAPKPKQFFVLPGIVAVSFFLIADMDSPRWGVIRVAPQNLISLSASLHAQ